MDCILVGCSGGPALIADWRFDGPKEDLIVGIISYANFSALEDSGVAFVKISKVRTWIDEIRRYQVCSIMGSFGFAFNGSNALGLVYST